MKRRNQLRGRLGGLSGNALLMPVVAVLAVLHVLIIVVIVDINASSASLSSIMQNAGAYTMEATSLQAGSSILSETASTYVLMPTAENGEVNVGPLIAYANELKVDRRGAQVLARFRDYDVNEAAVTRLAEAAECAESMMESQLHAIALMNAVYPVPGVPPLNTIPMPELTAEEQAMTDAQKEAAARVLVLGSVYSLNKQAVSQNVAACVEALQAESGARAGRASARIGRLRSLLWGITLTIIAILAITFSTLYVQVFRPLGRFVRLITANARLDEGKGLHEVRRVASAYNDVLRRRDALDEILRSAAETDALTNLPNRYRFEQYLLESGDSGYSVAVVLFDINYLKQTNDTEGHSAGDKLIRRAAECISSCFGESDDCSCFRFGGDEFAAVMKNCTPDAIRRRIDRFREVEKESDVSVALGYAFAEEIGETMVRQLLDEADRQMYAQKKRIHEEE